MKLTDIKQIGIIGAGQMGAGIALVSAKAGFEILLLDVTPERLAKALAGIQKGFTKQHEAGEMTASEVVEAASRIKTCQSLDAMAEAQFIVEAASEQSDLKSKIFSELGQICKPEVVLASNTSSISITKLGKAAGRGDRVAGMHFMNPVPVMRLVEVIRGLETSDETTTLVVHLAQKMGKTPIASKDAPGFIVNRILMPLVNEAVFALAEGVAPAEGIDQAMVLGTNQPMGPLALADRIGLDTVLAICETLYQDMGDPKFRPCPLLRKYVEAGWLGRKTGRGFFEYQKT